MLHPQIIVFLLFKKKIGITLFLQKYFVAQIIIIAIRLLYYLLLAILNFSLMYASV